MLPDHGWERLELNYRIVSGSTFGPILVGLPPEAQIGMSSGGFLVWVGRIAHGLQLKRIGA